MKHGPLSVLSPFGVGRSLRHLLYASPLYRIALKGRTPDSLRLQPPSYRLGDPDTGRAALNGTFTLSHHPVHLGKTPWTAPLASLQQQADLHGFSWLADLFAAGSDEARKYAGELLCSWVEQHRKWQPLPWRADVLGERLSAWLAFYDFLTTDQEHTKTVLLEMAMVQARHLNRSCAQAPDDARSFRAIQGLIFAAVCLPGAEGFLDMSLGLLNEEIRRQIFPDGGHFERNPSRVLELLSRFNQIRALLLAVHIEVPTELQGAIDKMSPMLRALRHGDGGLALFNGGHEEDRALVDTVLADTGVRGKALSSAPHSGFQRLAAGRTVIIADTGKPPLAGGINAHASSLSFEMSVGKDRLIVNCGSPGSEGDHWFGALQGTAAHSTLSVNSKDSTLFKSDGSLASGPANVECTRREADGSLWLETSHDGYRKSIGILHRRKLYLDASGEDFRGEDRVEGPGGENFSLRFHLHPGVHASQVQGKSTILLKLPAGAGWQFQASGGSITLEESIYLSGHGEPRRCEQIVISGPLHGDGAQVKWRLHRI
ncbi:MAG: heparinase II/III family protein [Rhodospirillales bacterium]|nr:heparinase II/III family protein [Rhodospirillales bacterium]